MSTNRFMLRAGALAATAGSIGLATTSPAAAHVTANGYGSRPEKGGYGTVALRLPNVEQDGTTSYQEFEFTAGPLPESEEPEPAPVVALAGPSSAGHGGAGLAVGAGAAPLARKQVAK
ncbi:hypothetical protein FHU38_004858 [Saccharomonospora amisosensis]|uniref:Uncharacterized protein n=1 Tax=Saccharomonospora amisosensis TaxID=1128677 RepID=A0A7X5ZT07_9PSEU|nr:hypothetical protein [Saccharomonospora amisosensis]NIJ14457.1 hypothetical protein [Saccharomonospora amisosensis]